MSPRPTAPTALGITLLVGLGAAAPAEARLGETLAQCQERYGEIRAQMPAVVAESDPESARFQYGTLSVIVHFQKGVAWHISYAQGYLSDPDKQRLLKENQDLGEWLPRLGEQAGNVVVWHHRQAKMVACAVNTTSLNTLEVMTRACTEAFARARAARIEAAVLASGTRESPAGAAATPAEPEPEKPSP